MDYKNLIGLRISAIDNRTNKIIIDNKEVSDVEKNGNDIAISFKNALRKIRITEDNELPILLKDGELTIDSDEYPVYIKITDFVKPVNKMKEEKEEVKIDNKYFIVSDGGDGKIISGYEFREQAEEAAEILPESMSAEVLSKKQLEKIGKDPADKSNWGNPRDIHVDVAKRAELYFNKYIDKEVLGFMQIVGLDNSGKTNSTEYDKLELYSYCLLDKIQHAKKYKLNIDAALLMSEYDKVQELLSQF